MPKVIGHDKDGIPRVYAIDDYHQTAHGFCVEEAKDYVKRRPETGPLAAWWFGEFEDSN